MDPHMRRLSRISAHLLNNHLRQSAQAAPIQRKLTAAEALEARRLIDKCAIVTGAGNGIGEATAIFFAKHGAKVVCADLFEDAAKSTAEQINADYPGCAVAMKVDVSKKEDNIAMVELCMEKFGQVDILFANAGMMEKMVPIKDETEETFRKTLEVNTMGVFMAIKYASEAMKKSGGGAIVVTASIAALRADRTPLQYAASKGALLSLVTSANDRLSFDNIRVNAVLPGGVNTNIVMGIFQQMEEEEVHLPHYDYKRFPPIDPEDVAKAVMFLASDDSANIKGHALVVDNGMVQSMGSQPYPVKKKKLTSKSKN